MLSHPLCPLKRTLFKARKSWIFFEVNFTGSKTINAICLRSHRLPKSYWLQKISEGLGDRFILTDILYSCWKQLASSFFRNNNYCVPDQGNVGHYTKKSYCKGVDVFIKYLLRLIFWGFLLLRRHLLFFLGSLVNDWNYFWNKHCNLPFLPSYLSPFGISWVFLITKSENCCMSVLFLP